MVLVTLLTDSYIVVGEASLTHDVLMSIILCGYIYYM